MSRLTATKIASTKATDGRLHLWCGDMPGFGVRICPGGSKQFLVRYRNQYGKPKSLTIGRCDVITVEEARRRAKDALGRVARGEDPAGEKADARAAATVQALYDRWLREHAPKLKPLTRAKQIRQWERFILPRWRTRAVASIEEGDVSKLLGDLHETPGQANRVRALLHKSFNLAERWGMRPKRSNPVTYVDAYPENPEASHKPLHIDEAGWLYTTAERMPENRASAVVRLYLLTGKRREEINSAKREWFSKLPDGWGVLRLPDSKGGSTDVDLVPEAVAIIEALPVIVGNPYLFPSTRRLKPGKQPRPRAFPYRDWMRLEAAAGLPHRRIHDLRHTFGTAAGELGENQAAIGGALDHKQLSTTEIYVTIRRKTRRRAVERTAGAILAARKTA